jgi:hypothetical protein
LLTKYTSECYNGSLQYNPLAVNSMNGKERQLPLARRQDLIVKELQDEVMVYDSKRNKAFCLNQTSAAVWQHCDGNTTIPQITQALRGIDSSMNDSVVWFALQQLESDGLLEQSVTAPSEVAGLTRKEVIKKFGLAAALVPLVAVLVAPTPAKAFSGVAPSY